MREQTERVNPDVVLQFSWGNDKSYDIEAINAMMNRAVATFASQQLDNEAPKLGFLVQIRLIAKKRTNNDRRILNCVDVYRIPRDTTYEDAKLNRNGASH